MIILLFPSMSISNQSIVNQNYIENEALVSRLSRSFNLILGKVYRFPAKLLTSSRAAIKL